MTRDTSIEAYNTIKDNGLLSKRRWEVYSIMFKYGPMTQTETQHKLGLIGHAARSVTPRFAELKKSGVFIETCKRICSITGRTVYEWDVTKRIPTRQQNTHKQKCLLCDGKGYTID